MTETKPRISLNAESLATWNAKKLEYLRYDYDIKPGETVIDLGAYKGEWALNIWRKSGCKLVVVEPTEYIKDFQHGTVINMAASTHDKSMFFGGRAYYTSVFEDSDHTYPCFDINMLLEQHQEIALLKVNIEGSEYDVMNHIIGAGLHKRIKNIQIQFHEIAGVPYEIWYKEIEKQLSKTHSLTWQYKYCWENWKLNDRLFK